MNHPIFHLDLRHPEQHLIRVKLIFKAGSVAPKLQLPCWTPGSYLERDYVKHLEGIEACCNGKSSRLQRLDQHSWRITSACPGDLIEIDYSLIAVEPSVRTNWLDHQGGFLTAAAWALQVPEFRWHPHQLELQLPPGWQLATGLSSMADGSFLAKDFDQLVDSPIALGNLKQLEFSVAGVSHRWVWQGLLDSAPVQQWQQDLPKLCAAACALMGCQRPPAKQYLFMTRFCGDGYGGLEHDDSAALLFSRRELASAAGYRRLLQLVGHEYLHQWNVRRLRPQELRPYSYGAAVIVPTLWFAEGITSYLDQLLVLVAGLCSTADYLRDLSVDISRYLTTPGRAVQSLQQSSEEAWVKLYKRDSQSDNQQLSYYLKGQLVALLLDLHLLSIGSDLTDLLGNLWRCFGALERGYSQADLLAATADLAPDLGPLLQHWLTSVDELPLESYLRKVGMRLIPEHPSSPHTGLLLETVQGQVKVRRVERHSPGEQAGLSPGDELLALDGERLRQGEQLDLWLRSGVQHQLLFCRDAAVHECCLYPAVARPRHWQLQSDPSASVVACQLRHRWLWRKES